MKMNKFFMLGLAGLAFAACNNDEELGNQFPEGKAAVSVKIVTPTLNTRNAGAATEGVDGSTVSLTGELTVTLTGSNGYNETITIDANAIDQNTALTFWNVETPQKLTVSINGGVADYTSVALSGLQKVAAEAPAYGEIGAGDFTLTTETGTPDLDEDNDTKENGTEQGAEESNANSTYQLYKATVTMRIPLARLEVSDITHFTHTGTDDDVCKFTKLIANGAYLDGYTPQGGTYEATGFTAGGTANDYSFDGEHGTGNQSDLRDDIGTEGKGLSFMAGETLAGPFTYNFYANGKNPTFKLYFGTAEGTNVISPRYAMITKYKKWNAETSKYEEVTFENGKIYRILSANLTDANIIGDEGGNTLYGVEVTVVEATWSLMNIEADWAE